MINVVHLTFLGYDLFSYMSHDPIIIGIPASYMYTQVFVQGNIQHLALVAFIKY